MKIPTKSRGEIARSNVKDLQGFAKFNRYIVLSEISSDSIPDIIDMIFNILPCGLGSVLNNTTKKTSVTVINTSEVYGDIHGTLNTRTRNAMIHYGFADTSMDHINGETVITFTDMDWNIIVDKPHDNVPKEAMGLLNEVRVSYDIGSSGGIVQRDNMLSNRIILPDPLHYDEKDQVLLSGSDENYFDSLSENSEDYKFVNPDNYVKNLFRCQMEDLVDSKTVIAKLNIKIENLTTTVKSFEEVDEFNQMITEIVAEGKYNLEICGFSGCELILGGDRGFTLSKMSTHLSLSKEELNVIKHLLLGRMEDLNELLINEPFEMIATYSYSNVNVKLFDKVKIIGENSSDTSNNTRQLGEVLGQSLKRENSLYI